jgi:hypothetical protein
VLTGVKYSERPVTLISNSISMLFFKLQDKRYHKGDERYKVEIRGIAAMG